MSGQNEGWTSRNSRHLNEPISGDCAGENYQIGVKRPSNVAEETKGVRSGSRRRENEAIASCVMRCDARCGAADAKRRFRSNR
ncbi:hypothetical protein J6590_021623 [Homalodisca vitripennis]|nr:hypothetical protein J6590_021623 [Homalodisca vitripennis]